MITDIGFLRLLTWASPAFPTGGFAWSHGLEWAVEAGDVRDEDTAQGWIEDVLRNGAGRSDCIILRHACRTDDVAHIDELASAMACGRERQAETLAQGTAFARAASVWDADTAAAGAAFPVAVGQLARRQALDEDPAALAFLHVWIANLVSAAVRLVPLGQTAGLRILARLEPTILAVMRDTRHAPLDDAGGTCFRADIASLRHETQYTRLFRS